MKKLLDAIKHPESVRVTARERTVLGLVKHVMLDREFIVKQSMFLALTDSYGKEIDRTNLIHRMASMVRKRMKGKIIGVSRYSQAELLVDVAQQLYWVDQAEEEPLVAEAFVYGYDGRVKAFVRPRFIPHDLSPKPADDAEPKIPLFRKSRDTLYRQAHVLGKAWDNFSLDLQEEVLMVGKYSADMLMQLYMSSSDYTDTKRTESQADRITRAKAAIKYLISDVCGKAIVFSAVPDARSRVAKYRIYFADTKEELNVLHSWFINFFGESWQTALYERYERYEITEDGMEDLEVTMARGYWKDLHSQRLSWKKARNLFKKENVTILNHCAKSFKHGLYYPKMAKLYRSGLGTMTGFMIEADLSASGIGSAAMNIRSKKIAQATALAGSATPSDAHRGVVERILHEVMPKTRAKDVIHSFYKEMKKKNVEITHAQSIAVTALTWNTMLDNMGIEHSEITPEILQDVYDQEMPGMLTWIESMTSITQVGVAKNYPTLYFHATDGVKCATSAFTESRMFKSRSVDVELRSRTITFQMRMPIEVSSAKRIVWDSYENTENSKLRNKMMGVWANLVQADDARGKRKISKEFKAIHGYVPIVKHDGYHVKLGHVKSLTTVTYGWRIEQFKEQPMKRGFNEMADFLNIARIDLPSGDLTLADMHYHNVSEAPFMMT